MKLPIAALLLGALTLAACQKTGSPAWGGVGGQFGGKARYIGVGLYTPGRMWSQLAGAAAPKDPAAAVLKDDEQVVVVLDSLTGELRQCGNLSGYCTRMTPWDAKSAPAALAIHAEQLDAEQAAANAAAEARLRKSPARRRAE